MAIVQQKDWSLPELAQILGARLQSRDGEDCAGVRIRGLQSLMAAGPGQLTFLANPQYRNRLAATQAAAVLLREADAAECLVPALICADPYLAYARASQLFVAPAATNTGIHASAQVASDVQLGAGVSIGACAVLGAGVMLADGVVIGPGCVIGERVTIAAGSRLMANVTLYPDVVLGERVVLHSGVVIGADGFGYAPDRSAGDFRWQKIAQLGSVRIGNDVEIGANSTVDRGALDDTVIAEGVIIDNQVQIGHNVVIGAHTAIAASSGIAGSTRIGRGCTIAGMVGIAGHLEIGDNVHVTAMTLVGRSLASGGSYSSGAALDSTDKWRRNTVRARQLDALFQRVKALESELARRQPSPEQDDQAGL